LLNAGERSVLAKPTITIAWNEEIFSDHLGQRWSPASVRLEWPSPDGLRGPTVTVEVIALARPDMTQDELEDQHIQSARDVLTAALLAIEEPIYQSMLLPPSRSMSKRRVG
jgi:hypothetical protein